MSLVARLAPQARYLVHKLSGHLRNRRDDVRSMARARQDFYRAAWGEAAAALDADLERLGGDVLEIRRGERRVRVAANASAFDDTVSLAVASHKGLVHRLLTEAGIPVPRYQEFPTADPAGAARFLASLDGAAVVKPLKGTGAGQGVTANVRDRRQLARATAWARTFSDQAIIEQQVPGESLRLLFLDGELLDGVLRGAPCVTGDGRSTLRRLVEEENRARLAAGWRRAQSLAGIDPDLRHALAEQGLDLRSVPAAGETVRLKHVVNDNRADENRGLNEILHPELVEAARRAAAIVGVRLAGVDLVASDPARPLSETGGVILEINTRPGYYYHQQRPEAPVHVTTHLLRRMLEG